MKLYSARKVATDWLSRDFFGILERRCLKGNLLFRKTEFLKMIRPDGDATGESEPNFRKHR